jgi:flavin reductase (DIM6/NTAB) family NADH-FMN oxidoreductase RutF
MSESALTQPCEVRHDRLALRRAFGQFPTGVSIITTAAGDGRRVGVTSNSFASLSLDPALVTWNLQRTSNSIDVFMSARHFLVNVLSVEQLELARHFAISSPDKFAGLEHEIGLGSCPLFSASLAHFECRTEARIEGGDHVLFVGMVERCASRDGKPLIYSAGNYGRMAPRAVESASVSEMSRP